MCLMSLAVTPMETVLLSDPAVSMAHRLSGQNAVLMTRSVKFGYSQKKFIIIIFYRTAVTMAAPFLAARMKRKMKTHVHLLLGSGLEATNGLITMTKDLSPDDEESGPKDPCTGARAQILCSYSVMAAQEDIIKPD